VSNCQGSTDRAQVLVEIEKAPCNSEWLEMPQRVSVDADSLVSSVFRQEQPRFVACSECREPMLRVQVELSDSDAASKTSNCALDPLAIEAQRSLCQVSEGMSFHYLAKPTDNDRSRVPSEHLLEFNRLGASRALHSGFSLAFWLRVNKWTKQDMSIVQVGDSFKVSLEEQCQLLVQLQQQHSTRYQWRFHGLCITPDKWRQISITFEPDPAHLAQSVTVLLDGELISGNMAQHPLFEILDRSGSEIGSDVWIGDEGCSVAGFGFLISGTEPLHRLSCLATCGEKILLGTEELEEDLDQTKVELLPRKITIEGPHKQVSEVLASLRYVRPDPLDRELLLLNRLPTIREMNILTRYSCGGKSQYVPDQTVNLSLEPLRLMNSKQRSLQLRSHKDEETLRYENIKKDGVTLFPDLEMQAVGVDEVLLDECVLMPSTGECNG
ncbi:hypothetical protein Ciccas_012717, partial [Cichlidogyrus casuarinus]